MFSRFYFTPVLNARVDVVLYCLCLSLNTRSTDPEPPKKVTGLHFGGMRLQWRCRISNYRCWISDTAGSSPVYPLVLSWYCMSSCNVLLILHLLLQFQQPPSNVSSIASVIVALLRICACVTCGLRMCRYYVYMCVYLMLR